MIESILNDETGAILSDCRKYRYVLWRQWDSKKPYCLFIGLNPSTADETLDDPTIRRCVRFSKDWGYGSCVMANIFAFRATKPVDMKSQIDPVGIDNNVWLQDLARNAGKIICAWGTHGNYLERDDEVFYLLHSLHLQCLGTTKAGHPKHPLYLRSDTQPVNCINNAKTKEV